MTHFTVDIPTTLCDFPLQTVSLPDATPQSSNTSIRKACPYRFPFRHGGCAACCLHRCDGFKPTFRTAKKRFITWGSYAVGFKNRTFPTHCPLPIDHLKKNMLLKKTVRFSSPMGGLIQNCSFCWMVSAAKHHRKSLVRWSPCAAGPIGDDRAGIGQACCTKQMLALRGMYRIR